MSHLFIMFQMMCQKGLCNLITQSYCLHNLWLVVLLNISLTVWHVGYQSHGILGNFDIFPTKSAIS